MNPIDILAFKMYSFDTDSFVEDIIRYSNKSIILVFDFDKIIVQYKPSNINLEKTIARYWRTKNSRLNYYISPLLLLVDMFVLTKLFLTICWKYRPKICWTENLYAGLVVGTLRKCRLCNKSIYVPGDWVANSQNRKLLSYVGNNLIFPILDYLACKLNDVVVNHTEKVAEARYRFWGRKIAKNEKLYRYKMQIKASNSYGVEQKRAICFIGNMREDSGLDIVIKSLTEIRKKCNIILKIVGPKKQHYEYFKRLSKEYGVEQYVKFLGFVETDKLAEIFSDCFCGINLITNMNSYSSYIIPGKLIHYLQFLLPVIVTEGSGPFVPVIRDNELGLVIEPTQEKFVNAVFKIYDDYRHYKGNIIQYIDSIPKIDIKELIEN